MQPTSSCSSTRHDRIERSRQSSTSDSSNVTGSASDLVRGLQRSAIIDTQPMSFELANQREELLIKDEQEFIERLGCESTTQVKVISIFGNTGDGKSYTLNHTFLDGKEVFKTSPLQTSCTAGVWAAHDPVHQAILLDTEGLLGVTANQNQRTRLLLKVLAISDIVIYRTRSERLHSDMFQFLSDASNAYMKHFKVELDNASKRMQLELSVTEICPSLIIFHETEHTEILTKGVSDPAEKYIRDRFAELHLTVAFSSIQYVGTRTTSPPTDFKGLLIAAKKHLKGTDVRCFRQPAVVFKTLKILNDKFTGEIDRAIPNMFPDQYFTCRTECLACRSRCCRTMNHLKDNEPHHSSGNCTLQAQYENGVYTCKACFTRRGQTVVVVPKAAASTESSWLSLASYAWSGYVLECNNCGVIYRSRQHWYGNIEPEKANVVCTEIRHVWPGSNTVLMGTHNAARRLLDGLNYVSDSIAVVGAKPTKYVADWVTDKIAPPYWVPNCDIKQCHSCEVKFDKLNQIHHCRSCGQGFCESCSSKRRPVPERNWGLEPVRVCDACFTNRLGATVNDTPTARTPDGDSDGTIDANQLMPRKVGEVIGSTVGALASVVNYPYVALRDAARPTYWVADEEITNCTVCKELFGPKLRLHHCRSCGQGVCDQCSPDLRPVPSRGWDHPVRVCLHCSSSSSTKKNNVHRPA